MAGRDRWATLDLSASYRWVFDTVLPGAVQVADPVHVVKLANQALDECRRRVQNEMLGHRGRSSLAGAWAAPTRDPALDDATGPCSSRLGLSGSVGLRGVSRCWKATTACTS